MLSCPWPWWPQSPLISMDAVIGELSQVSSHTPPFYNLLTKNCFPSLEQILSNVIHITSAEIVIVTIILSHHPVLSRPNYHDHITIISQPLPL